MTINKNKFISAIKAKANIVGKALKAGGKNIITAVKREGKAFTPTELSKLPRRVKATIRGDMDELNKTYKK